MEASSSMEIALAKVPLFSRLSPQELSILGSKVQARSFGNGEVIFHKDDPGTTLYIITTGMVKIFLPSEEGQEVVLAIMAPGEFFGEMALLDGGPRSASAVAMEPTTTLILHREDFLVFIKSHQEAVMSVLGALSARLRHADGIIADAIFLDLPGRIAKKLLELVETFGHQVNEAVEIDMRLRQQDLASMVGATREAVNRILSALEKERIIKVEKQKITVMRPQALRDRTPLF